MKYLTFDEHSTVNQKSNALSLAIVKFGKHGPSP